MNDREVGGLRVSREDAESAENARDDFKRRTSSWKISRRPRRPRRFRSSLRPLFGPVRGTGRGERRVAGDDFKEGGTSDATLDQLQISITRGRVSGRAQDRPLDPEPSRTYSSRSGQAFRPGAWARGSRPDSRVQIEIQAPGPAPKRSLSDSVNCRIGGTSAASSYEIGI